MPRFTLPVLALLAAAFGVWMSASQQPDDSPVYAVDLQDQAQAIPLPGADLTLVNFWASWCQPCIEELPLLERHAEAHSPKLQVLALAIDSRVKVDEFLAKHPLKLPVAVGTPLASELMASWGNEISALPFSVLLNAEGELLKHHTGPFEQSTLEAFTGL